MYYWFTNRIIHNNLFIYLLARVGPSPLLLRQLTVLLYQPGMTDDDDDDDDCGVIVGMND
jgi:hypothetical protein